MSPGDQADTDAPLVLAEFVSRHIESGDWPSASWAVASADSGILTIGAAGHRSLRPRTTEAGLDTLYDLASLSKPLATAAIACRLAASGKIDLDAPLEDLLPELAGYAGQTPSLASLLDHSSGLPAWAPLYRLSAAPERVLETIAGLPATRRAGASPLYSCLGPIAAGIALERVSGAGLRTLFEQQITDSLGVDRRSLSYGPLDQESQGRAASTETGRVRERELASAHGDAVDEITSDREEPLLGEVHDGNSAFLGGASGNAGLFGTAEAVCLLGLAMLDDDDFIPASLRSRFATVSSDGPGGDARTFGFQAGRADNAPAGAFGESSFGHVGFTGTSIWLEPKRRAAAVLLTNRIHPRWTDAPIGRWRTEFHALARRVLEESRR